MDNKEIWGDIDMVLFEQRKKSTPQGNKDIRFMLIYLWIDYCKLDGYLKDLKAELEKKEGELFIEYKNSGTKYTIPEVEAMIARDLESLSDEIRKKQKDVTEMKMLYDSGRDYAKSIDTDLYIMNQIEKTSF